MSNLPNPIIVKCFCNEADNNSGNPAGIYLNLLIDDTQKQQLAKELNLPVTVFVSTAKNDIPSLEFFYPHRKMPLCLHGALAAAHILFKESNQQSMTVRVMNGARLQLNQHAFDHFEVEVLPEKIKQPALSLMLGSALLNIDVSDIAENFPFVVASVGSPKLLIPLSSLDTLTHLNPNYSAIEKWSLEHKVNGVYAYSHQVENIFYARGFNPITGHQEDAATGVAAAALSLQLEKDIVVKQGETLGLPCEMNLRFASANSIWVGGKTVITMKDA